MNIENMAIEELEVFLLEQEKKLTIAEKKYAQYDNTQMAAKILK